MTKYKEWKDVGQFDVLVGGTPCQSFSVAGLRKGLDDPRGNLMLTFGAIADHFRPTWIVWENVPGVLSSNGGRDFGSFLGMLGKLGYGFSYRVLDAQYFGVAQRRRRVFVVGYLGDWRRAAQVLFESKSLCGNPPPSREAREGITGSTTQCFEPRSPDGCARLVGDISPTLNRMGGGQREPCIMSTGQGNAETTEGHAPTLNCNHEAPILAYGIPGNWIGRKPENGGNAVEPMKDVAPCLTKTDRHGVAGSTVRRLTPRECERLQGFPEERKTFILSPCVEEKNELAPSAAQSSQALNLGVKEHVLVNVLIDFERQHLQLHKAGRLLLSASFAEAKNSFLHHTQGEDFARLIALMKQEGDQIITTGKVESPRVNVLSSPQPNGSIYANLYGLGTEELASGAGLFISVATEHLKSITSQAGKSSLNLEQRFLTLSYFVASAINGFIQEKTQTENISPIRIETVCGWTRIPWRGKPAEECPDGPRYKACGNSMAVPVMQWIGERINTYSI
jgi:DNA (cytosine-5)-methyltransferase 1